ncbi:DoxX family protein [Lewinella sp. LCG006]|uniref:DoxX family protein n=1 Tax=Lewinella sp. LCG006 TaxID=3231911 RepID=UPI00346107D6
MNALLNLGKYLFAVPFLVFGAFHFMAAEQMAGMVPIPGGIIWVYLTGVGMIAAAISVFMGKMDKLATFLLGVLMLIFVFTLHLKGAMDGDQMSTTSLLKDLIIAGASWMYAGHMAKDDSVIG